MTWKQKLLQTRAEFDCRRIKKLAKEPELLAFVFLKWMMGKDGSTIPSCSPTSKMSLTAIPKFAIILSKQKSKMKISGSLMESH